ncbi:helix-hairpin-helix domain-containing protein [Pseudoxanthomonas beigongshangi]
MTFAAHEREQLLAAHGVGPTVIARLEQIGYHTLADLAGATPADINAQVAAMLGATCWRNSPQARTAIANAIAVAQAQSPNTSSKKSSIIR